MRRPLTQDDLNDQGCGTPGCDHDHSILFLHSACHPEVPTWVSYAKATGVLVIECGVCRKIVAKLKIAEQ